LYATCFFLGCWAYLMMEHSGVSDNIALWIGILVIVSLRMIAVRWDIRLPD
jgi:uncharacterized membrane protein YeiH